MQMLYNSESYVVVRFEVDGAAPDGPSMVTAPTGRGGYQIVDKCAGKEIYLQGVMATHFQQGVDALIEAGPSEEDVDAFLERFAALMQQPVVLH